MVALQRSQPAPREGQVLGSCVQLSPVAASPKQRHVLGEHNQASARSLCRSLRQSLG